MARSTVATGLLGLLLLGRSAFAAPQPTPEPTPVERVRMARQKTAEAPDITAVSDCHTHATDLWCMAGPSEYLVDYTVTNTKEYPAQFTDCHSHAPDLFCVGPDGSDVLVSLGGGAEDEHEDESDGEPAEENCHFHAGVEHCVSAGGSENGERTRDCSKVDRDYNIPLRIGLIFAVLGTSSLGVFAPIFLVQYLPTKLNVVLVMLKQFGTGIIISTAFAHLFVHAMLMFQNPCIEGLDYEGTAAVITMAGIFVSFLIEYFGQRFMKARLQKKMLTASPEDSSLEKQTAQMEMVNVTIMEAGIIFHSIIIGVTLVVAGDSFFLTLFIVIVFHQFFEGLALGSRIAELGTNRHFALSAIGHHHHHTPNPPGTNCGPLPETSAKSAVDQTASSVDPSEQGANPADQESVCTVPMWKKMVMATCFAVVTPVGMAIGTGVLSYFNGNDPATAIAIGTLDAFSAGILVWVGVVEMWAADWMGGEMSEASPLVTAMGLASLMLGMALMSLLGKWA